jgi:hypothetical protein
MAATIAFFALHREQSGNTQNPVGAGLPAMAVYQSTSLLPDTPSSRASPLPQVYVALTKSQAKKSPISLMRSIGLEHSGATSAKGGSMRVQA